MKRLGYRVFEERGFNIYEVLEDTSAVRTVLGFAVSGNGIEPLVVYACVEEAKEALAQLHRGWTPLPASGGAAPK
jgi:hypothetical protein